MKALWKAKTMITLQKWLPSLIEGFTFYGGGKGDAPKAPDYSNLAKEQAAQQLALNRSTTKANRVDQFTPFGSVTYTQGGGEPTFDQAAYDAAMAKHNKAMEGYRAVASRGARVLPGSLGGIGIGSGFGGSPGAMPVAPDRNSFYTTGDPDKWSSTVTLDPELQKIVDQKFSAQQQGYDALQSYLANINDASKVPHAVVNPGMKAQDAIMARLNPDFSNREEELRTRLYNQGVRPGTEAWDREFNNFSQGRNDAYSQAALYGINLDNAARANALQEQALPMNAISAYNRGTDIAYPQFNNYAPQANAAAPDLMGAAQGTYGANMNAYNADQAASSNFMNGLFSLGGSLGNALLFSDRRLKKNIEKVGEYKNGLNKYSFEYLWGEKSVGAMADEVEKVMPWAVGDVNGYKTVNYSMLGD